MSETISRADIRAAARSVKGETPIGACRRAASQLGTLLRQNLDSDRGAVEVRQGYLNGGDKMAEHFYVIVDAAVVEDVPDSADEIIVDPTIQQFTKDNFYEGCAETYVEMNPSNLPDVGLFSPGDEGYEWYE